ncbi:MAG TPA: rhodanese-like domain-containing protein [Acidobacteriaceae bacterium]|nr:rhodanese-like domain-containing protein [Acidobacteriaceae bacterium]
MLSLEISAAELAELQKTGKDDFVLLDVREPWEHQIGHLDRSVLMPMGDVPSRAHQELDPDVPIIVYCHHGVRSLNTAVWLRNQGFEHAQSLAGGIDQWSKTIDPSVPRY